MIEHRTSETRRAGRRPTTRAARNADRERPSIGEGLGGLGEIVGFHLRVAHNAVYRHFQESFARLDLSQKQTSVLWLIGENRGIAQIELAARLGIDRATTMAIVDRLEARDLLVRSRSVSDRRRQHLQLTTTGEEMLIRAKEALNEHELWLKNRIGDGAEVAAFVGALRRIYL